MYDLLLKEFSFINKCKYYIILFYIQVITVYIIKVLDYIHKQHTYYLRKYQNILILKYKALKIMELRCSLSHLL